MLTLAIVQTVLLAGACVLLLLLFLRKQETIDPTQPMRDEFAQSRREAADADARQRSELADTLDKQARRQDEELARFAQLLDRLNETQQHKSDAMKTHLDTQLRNNAKDQHDALKTFDVRLNALTERTTQQAQQLRDSIQKSLDIMREANEKKLEAMRVTVDEKLQGTLEKRLGESFRTVSEQLTKVHAGLGEMQNLAVGVGDLKRVMTNVKARGTWGEYALLNLIEQALTRDQYACNCKVKPDSNELVEVAVRLPGNDDDKAMWLPIDAKFPTEDFQRIHEAVDAAEPEAVAAARQALIKRITSFAKDIGDKYVAPPHTTNFAILFVPTEGLYAELAREPGLIEALQSNHRVMLAGPSNLLAMLNALTVGFRTLMLQKRSSEVWDVLSAVKTEFNKFGTTLAAVNKKLDEAKNKIGAIETRTNVMKRTLRSVESMDESSANHLLGLNGEDALEDGVS